MNQLTWKVRDIDGNLLFQTVNYDDALHIRQTVGKALRRAFPSRDGFSVTRCKVPAQS